MPLTRLVNRDCFRWGASAADARDAALASLSRTRQLAPSQIVPAVSSNWPQRATGHTCQQVGPASQATETTDYVGNREDRVSTTAIHTDIVDVNVHRQPRDTLRVGCLLCG